jgi:hypothetical protein
MRGLRVESGSALVAAMAVMSVMLMTGLTTFALVDSQQTQSGGERRSESAFNLAEAALNAHAFVLSRDWPGASTGAYPSTCTRTTAVRGCPDPAKIVSSFDSVDVDQNSTWTTTVRDDGGSSPNFYDDAVVQAQPTWDANGDHRVWVRSQAVVRGKPRAVVALVRVNEVQEQIPMNVLTAGHFSTGNNGNKTIVDTKGRPLAVRCKSQNNAQCLDFRAGQVSPPGSVQEDYGGGNALSDDAIDRLRTKAIALGTYYSSGCPGDMAGRIVFVENGNCSYNGGNGNSPSSPGVLVIMNGTLSLGGNVEYYGLVYMGNRQGSTGDVVTMTGNALIQGAVFIDGNGGMRAGADKENLIFDGAPFGILTSFGSAGILQNSWREIRGS